MRRAIKPARSIRVSLRVPGDKSISHRALMLAALADGDSILRGVANSEDVTSTMRCLNHLGTEIRITSDAMRVSGHGLNFAGQAMPGGMLDCGNSGTTARLLMGILAAQDGGFLLDGDESLRTRPMERVGAPLRSMGAQITYKENEDRLPLIIHGSQLMHTEVQPEVASAQVKSAVLLAGLCSGRGVRVIEQQPTRDHTEIMLRSMGAAISSDSGVIDLQPGSRLTPLNMGIPGDVSSAMYFIAAALLLPDSEVTVQGAGVNPTRSGILTVLNEMGAEIELSKHAIEGGEPVADITARSSSLQAASISAALVPSLIDELPLLAMLATQAEGRTEIRGAAELRVKESDRIATTAAAIRSMGGKVEELADGLVIAGPQQLAGGTVDSAGDHRIAMSAAVLALACSGETVIDGAECAAVSFPAFFEQFEGLCDGD